MSLSISTRMTGFEGSGLATTASRKLIDVAEFYDDSDITHLCMFRSYDFMLKHTDPQVYHLSPRHYAIHKDNFRQIIKSILARLLAAIKAKASETLYDCRCSPKNANQICTSFQVCVWIFLLTYIYHNTTANI